jgi:hypothetical protein
MAILYGTQSNGETLPVLVDQFGNLLAKGIEGQPGTPGTPGAQGPPGADGGSFPLPPDPYEGAFLGWLNNGLAWIGTPPVPVPDGRFGPITAYDPSGLLIVDGDIPQQVAQGVYVYQCNEDGTIYVDGWNNSSKWSDNASTNDPKGFLDVTPPSNAFDGDTDSYLDTTDPGKTITVTFPGGLGYSSKVEVFVRQRNVKASVNNGAEITISGGDLNLNWTEVVAGSGVMQSLSIIGTTNYCGFAGVRVDGQVLCDSGEYPTAPNLNFRVQSVNGQNLIGVANRTNNFSVGKYLRVPEQNVARWLYDGNLNELITSTGIDSSQTSET